MTHETIRVSNKMRAYIIRADVEFLQDGHAAQHNEQAADPQQQAKLPMDRIPPISQVFLGFFKTLHTKSSFNNEYKIYYHLYHFNKGSFIISLSSYLSNWPNIYFFAPSIDSSSPMFLLLMKFVILQLIDFKCFLSKFKIICYEEIQGCH